MKDIILEPNTASPITDINKSPKRLSEVHKAVIKKVHSEIYAPCCSMKCSNWSDFVDNIPHFLAHISSIPAILYFGLTLNDFKEGWYRWIFASASFITNYFQMMVVDQITFKRYLEYVKQLISAIKNGKEGFFELLDTGDLNENENKTLVRIKNIFQFLIFETTKICILYFISIVPASLARQVSWLNDSRFEKLLHFTTMLMLEPSLHDRLQNIRLPSLTNAALLKDEFHQFRLLFSQILNENSRVGIKRVEQFKSQILLDKILGEHSHHEDLLTHALSASAEEKKTTLIDPRVFYLRVILSFIFVVFESMANSGNYRATWENPDVPLVYHMGSILGDFSFCIFISLRASSALTNTLVHDFFSCDITEWEYRKLLLTVAGLLISSLTVGSALSVSNEEHMGFWVGFVGVLLGTILDSGFFLIEALLERDHLAALHSKNGNVRNHRAIIHSFYSNLREHYEQLTDQKFISLIKSAVTTNPNLFQGYEKCFHKALPWSRRLTPAQVIETLSKKPEKAMKVINANGHFGLKRKGVEGVCCLLAFILSGSEFLNVENPYLSFLFKNIAPWLAIPTSVGALWLLDAPSTDLSRSLLDSEPEEISGESPPSATSTLLVAFMLSGATYGIKFGSQFVIHWIASNIFDQSDEDAEMYSMCASQLVSIAATVGFSHSLLRGSR